jgi:hypothetical protein
MARSRRVECVEEFRIPDLRFSESVQPYPAFSHKN